MTLKYKNKNKNKYKNKNIRKNFVLLNNLASSTQWKVACAFVTTC